MIMEWIKKLTDIIMPMEPVVEEEDDAKETKKTEAKAEESKTAQAQPIQQQAKQQQAAPQQPIMQQRFQAEKQAAAGGFGAGSANFTRTGGTISTAEVASVEDKDYRAFSSEVASVRPSLAVVKTPQITMKIYTPTKYDEIVKSIGTDLIKHNAIVVNYDGADASIQQRIGDFVLGVVYTVNGRVEKISDKIVLYVPEGFDIEPAQAAVHHSALRRYN